MHNLTIDEQDLDKTKESQNIDQVKLKLYEWQWTGNGAIKQEAKKQEVTSSIRHKWNEYDRPWALDWYHECLLILCYLWFHHFCTTYESIIILW